MQNSQDNLKEIESLLEFYRSAGVDCFLGDEPVDWAAASMRQTAPRHQAVSHPRPSHKASVSAQSRAPEEITSANAPPQRPAAPSQQPAQSHQPASAQAAVVPDREMIASARDLAASAASLADLKACLETFEGCNLKLTAKTLVFGDGNPEARLMLVGEAPGREEDLQGKPFVGRSGQLLDRMLSAIGLDREAAYIANVVPWRPPGNRTPTPQETEICKPFIKRQIELVNPDVLVFLGAASAKNLLGVQDGIRKMRGRWMNYTLADREIAAVATYHPAYLLRSPLEKRLSWRDFLSIRSRLAGR
ncbi:uracil-DNA glycosylase [Roseibium sp.]|uniref:uracil-DNA glycosylase n=1 Tax=Roseibium sp. TaxID=1936156 RepID=UPI003B5106C4